MHISLLKNIKLHAPYIVFIFFSSFCTSTETKSGRVIKSPSKFSSCVSGQRQPSKGCKISCTSDSTMANETLDVTSTSMYVNVSHNDADDTEFESTLGHDSDVTYTTDIPNEYVKDDNQYVDAIFFCLAKLL